MKACELILCERVLVISVLVFRSKYEGQWEHDRQHGHGAHLEQDELEKQFSECIDLRVQRALDFCFACLYKTLCLWFFFEHEKRFLGRAERSQVWNIGSMVLATREGTWICELKTQFEKIQHVKRSKQEWLCLFLAMSYVPDTQPGRNMAKAISPGPMALPMTERTAHTLSPSRPLPRNSKEGDKRKTEKEVNSNNN